MRKYRHALQFALILLVIRGFVACSTVDFDQAPPTAICSPERSDCVVEPRTRRVTVNGGFRVQGDADIVFVLDNSNSMSPILRQMADRFRDLISNVQYINYRIAFTSTDTETTTKAWPTDGRFLTLDNGRKFIDNTSGSGEQLFYRAIDGFRAQTAACEARIRELRNIQTGGSGSFRPGYRDDTLNTLCAADDEQGIKATHRMLERKDSEVLRPTGHLAVIIVANEDERSCGGRCGNPNTVLQEANLAGLLPDKFRRAFPQTGLGLQLPNQQKTFAVHSLIIKPGDTSCLTEQRNSMLDLGIVPQFGIEYANAANATGGITGSVCSRNYAVELEQMSRRILAQMAGFRIDCDTNDLVVRTEDSSVNIIKNGRDVTFSGPLPVGSRVTYSYTCPEFY